ncbi:MAG: chorismate mutase [Thalassospira sp.]|uniref:chorismate mutase n=1 Tax=Thalassospira sp. TaxID=1912094 RepID=UPI003A8B707F
MANLDLDGLRGEIDEIDQALQSLIIRRTKVVQAVGAYKDRVIAAGGKVKVPYRPAREARIMRTLVSRHDGAFPKTALIQIWREMIAAGTRLEAPYTVALCRNADGLDCWELARLNFGCLNEIVEFDTPREAFSALEEGRAAVGVFPKPELGEAMPWWTLLTDDSAVKVVSKLPFGGRPVGRGEQTEGFVLAAIDLEDSGDDRTLFVVSLSREISMDTARKKIADAIDGATILGFSDDTASERRFVLVDVPGFFCNRADAFDAMLAEQGLSPESLRIVGTYAVPIAEDALS